MQSMWVSLGSTCFSGVIELIQLQDYSHPMPDSTIVTSSGADDLNTTVGLGLPPSRNTTTKLQSKTYTMLHHIDTRGRLVLGIGPGRQWRM